METKEFLEKESMNENWLPIEGYEGLYEVSDLGRVRNRRGIIMKLHDNGHGYFTVGLYKNGKAKHLYIHRLVATAYIPNPDNLPQVNHKNEDKTDNRVENLEWCTGKYNMNYGTLRDRLSLIQTNNPKSSEKVVQLDLNGNYISEYPSMKEAGRVTGIITQEIQACCKSKLRKCHGYIFICEKDYTEEYVTKRVETAIKKIHRRQTKEHRQKIGRKLLNGKSSKPVLQFSKSGEFIREWPSTSEVHRILGFNQGNISNCCLGRCKSAYGFVWQYK